MSALRARATGVLTRAALGLYPPAWRARYGDEVRALLDDSGAGLRAAAGLAWHAVPAWAWPPRQLYDRSGRMRASLATVLAAWALLAGLAAVFVQLAQAQGTAQGLTLARHPVIQWSYWVFDASAGVAVLAVAAVIVGLVRHPAASVVVPWQPTSNVDLANGMVGLWWFLTLVVLGFAAAAASAAGPGMALRAARPEGPAVIRATRAAGLAAVAMSLAGAASVVAAVGLYLWRRIPLQASRPR